jgi:[ribosomal protein S5]-alanine N-acetyltransferase
MELHTSRLLLRDFTLIDIDAVHAYQSEPRYLAHSPWRTRSRADVADFVQMLIEWSLARPRIRYQLAIVHGAALIGSCGIRRSASDAIEAEFGCELAHAAWGQGYAAEASRAILAFGFRELRLRRILAKTTMTNSHAIALARRLGMREEASTHEADSSDHAVAFEINEPNWNEASAPGSIARSRGSNSLVRPRTDPGHAPTR